MDQALLLLQDACKEWEGRGEGVGGGDESADWNAWHWLSAAQVLLLLVVCV